MARIFFALSVISITLLLTTMGLGFWVDDVHGKSVEFQRIKTEFDELKRTPGAEQGQLDSVQTQLDAAAEEFYEVNRVKMIHFLLGVLSTLVVVLVNCVSVTYFIGTERWCREVIETYQLKPELMQTTRSLKRTAFPWSLLGIVSIIVVSALGAASDPSANYGAAGDWLPLHRIVAIMSTCAMIWAYLVQVGKVGANYELILEILKQADQLREAAQSDKEDRNGD